MRCVRPCTPQRASGTTRTSSGVAGASKRSRNRSGVVEADAREGLQHRLQRVPVAEVQAGADDPRQRIRDGLVAQHARDHALRATA